jgi:hypothetical protein
MIDDALVKFPKDPLSPKFMLLRAYSTAPLSDERGFKEELTSLIKTWPESVESKKATEIIAFLNQKVPELKVEEDKKIASVLYVADTTENHRFAVVITNPAFNINLATFDVISYNIDNYTNNNYRTEGTLIDNRFIIITVSGFKNYTQTLDYFKAFRLDQVVRNPSGAKMLTFTISESNLKVLNNDKDPLRYQLFFLENYMK